MDLKIISKVPRRHNTTIQSVLFSLFGELLSQLLVQREDQIDQAYQVLLAGILLKGHWGRSGKGNWKSWVGEKIRRMGNWKSWDGGENPKGG